MLGRFLAGRCAIILAYSVLYTSIATSGAAACEDGAAVTLLEGWDARTDCSVSGTVRFAYNSFGESNFPLNVVRGQEILQKRYPNLIVEWLDIRQSADSRAALLAGQVDVITSSTTVYVQSWSKGVDYRVLTPITGYDGWLVVRPDGPDSILEFVGTTMKISPGPGSTQYFAAQAALAKAGENVNALQSNWVQIQAPEAQQLLLHGSANELGGTWDTDKWSLMNQDVGLKRIASYSETLPFPTSNVIVAMNGWVAAQPELAAAVTETIGETNDWLEANQDKGAELLVAFAEQQHNAKADLDLYKRLFSEKMLYASNRDVKLREVLAFMRDTINIVDKSVEAPTKETWYFYPDKAGESW